MSATSVPTRGRRHSIAAVTRARALYEAGWTQVDIRRLLIRERLVDDVAPTTVTRWVNAEAQQTWEANIRDARAARAKRRGERPMGYPHARPEFKLARVRALRAAGMKMSDIAIVMSHDFEPVTEAQIRHALRIGRWPKRVLRQERSAA